jgi:protein-L-isoaspartate(D-aspartate) O-methyltransferase
MDIERARFNMVEQQIRPWDVLDSDVLELLYSLKRETFVTPAYRAMAFTDMEIPLNLGDRRTGQSMFSPKMEARILQELSLQRNESVLEVGAGSGYMAALLGHRAHHVISLEIVPALADAAHHRLREAGVRNVEVRIADGAAPGEGVEGGPFDVIVLSGSVAQVPPELLALLKTGGRLSAIVGDEPVMRASLSTRVDAHALSHTAAWDTLAPRLLNFPTPSTFRF